MDKWPLFLAASDHPDLINEAKESGFSRVVHHTELGCLPLFPWHPKMLDKGIDTIIFDAPKGGEDTEPQSSFGIYPEASDESIEEALAQRDIPNTQIGRELYMTGRCDGLNPGPMEIMSPDFPGGVRQEPIPDFTGTYINKHKRQVTGSIPGYDYINPDWKKLLQQRQERMSTITAILKVMRICCDRGIGPAITKRNDKFHFTTTNLGKLFDQKEWNEATKEQLIQATWNFIFSSRRKWLEMHPKFINFQHAKRKAACIKINDQTIYITSTTPINFRTKPIPRLDLPCWLSEENLHAIREAFRELIRHYKLDDNLIKINEEAKPSRLQKLQTKLAQAIQQENCLINRLERLGKNPPPWACEQLEKLAVEIEELQARIEWAVLCEARANGYDEEFLGYDIAQTIVEEDELDELKTELTNQEIYD